MHKLVVIRTHGVTVLDGTHIFILASFNRIEVMSEDLIAAYHYSETGKLLRHLEGVFAKNFWEIN